VDEKVLEEIQFHQETIASDDNSPLHLIREKEMEISGRVLAAKREAEEIVAEARRKAAKILATAEEQGAELSEAHKKAVVAEVEAEVEQIHKSAEAEIASLNETVADRTGKAVDFVVESVTNV
jgi:vacuolar-type H+-ATPase subunit H